MEISCSHFSEYYSSDVNVSLSVLLRPGLASMVQSQVQSVIFPLMKLHRPQAILTNLDESKASKWQLEMLMFVSTFPALLPLNC